MRQFFKYTLATMLGLFLSWFLFFVLVIAIASSDDQEVVVEDNSVLKINLDISISDFDSGNDLPKLPIPGMNAGNPTALKKILDNISKAKNDQRIKGIVLSHIYGSQGDAQLSEIREKLIDFKSSGKFIYAYSDIYSQKGYWLSSVADSIFLNPFGSIEFKGLAAEILYFKGLQDKFGVKFDVIRHGEFKSAVEPYLLNSMSDENKKQIQALIDVNWDKIKSDIALSRNISLEKLNEIASNRWSDDSKLALENGLADKLVYSDQFEQSLANRLNTDVSGINVISLKKYSKSKDLNAPKYSRDRIAVLYAEGEIVYNGDGITGTEVDVDLVESIREISEDENINGLILRINSPGGSALTSEIIWRELKLLQEKMPVYVSMGNYAASGGYYIASASDKIFADETSITGSIGVFGLIPNAEKAANDLGIRSDIVSTNDLAFEYSLTKGANAQIKAKILEDIDRTYKTFVTRVADNRQMSFDQVDKIAQGRVWTGKDAKNIGLVDEIGGLENCIQNMAQEIGLENYRLIYYPEKEDDFSQLVKILGGEIKSDFIANELGDEFSKHYSRFKTSLKKETIQASIPFEFNIY